MKKLFLMLIIVVTSVMTYSQTSIKAEMYRCSSLGFSTLDDKSLKWSEYKMEESNIIIRNNLSQSEITIGGGKKDIVVYLVRRTDHEEKVDKDGDKYTISIYDAYDQDGISCEWIKIDYPEYTNINFVIRYSNFKVFMECNIIK